LIEKEHSKNKSIGEGLSMKILGMVLRLRASVQAD